MTLGAKIKKTELLIIKTKKELDHLPKNIGSNLILKAIPTNRTRRARAISRQNPADFAHTMFELRPKNTANLQFQNFGERLPRRVAPRQARSAEATSYDFSESTNWRRGWDSNPRSGCPDFGFQDRHIRPLCHPSKFILTISFNHFLPWPDLRNNSLFLA